MTKGVNRIIGAKPIHAEVMQRTDVHRQRAAELFRFLVDRPVHFRAEVIFDSLAKLIAACFVVLFE
jgi:hypothetical protein